MDAATVNTPLLPLTKVNIDLSALADNLGEIRRIIGPAPRIMGVVKADAYGHGALTIAETILDEGADFLAVARISEAVELRNAGISAPVLLLGDVEGDQVPYLGRQDIRTTVTSLEIARFLSRAAVKSAVSLKVHIKVDTGMGRLGFMPDSFSQLPFPISIADKIKTICQLPGLEVEGIYTHFANADCRDKTHAELQLSLFTQLLGELEEMGIRPAIRHAANSAALLEMPHTHLDMVRAGIAMYGLWPSEEMDRTRAALKPVMSITSRIIHLKQVPAGFAVSYGSTYRSTRETRIATVPIGYADGYKRLLSSRADMIVRGTRVPVAGRVCMDMTMIDVGALPRVQVGDRVTILGRQQESEVSAEEIATLCGTINYEVVSSLTRRMPRRYFHTNKEVLTDK